MADIAIANVVAVIGTAYARNADGELRELKPGDVLLEGETVVTPDGSRVELELTNGNPFIVSDVEEMAITRDLMAETAAGADESALEDESVDAILAALESGEDLGDVLQATAAGGSASGPGGEGSSFIRLGRIAEDTPELSGVIPNFASEDVVVVEESLQPVDAIDDFETSSGEPVTIAAKANDIFLEGEIITDFTQAANGTVSYDQQTMLFTYTPNEGFSGTDTFTYDAINPTGTAGDTAVVTIVVDPPAPEPEPEPLPTISIGDAVVQEGDTAFVTIALSKSSDEVVTVRFDSFDGTAKVVTGDYDPVTGIVTFAPGQTEVVISIPTNVDDIQEGTEDLTVELSDPSNAEILDGTGVVQIVDDFTPTLSINDVTVTEGQTAVVTVTLSASVDEAVTVNFATANGSAASGADYDATSGTLTFAPGQTVATVSVSTIDDDVEEDTENLVVNLSGATNAVVVKSQGVVTILDNDDPAPPPPPPGDVAVGSSQRDLDEANLAAGTSPQQASLAKTGDFTILAEDGLLTLSVTADSGTIDVVAGGVFQGGFVVEEGVLRITFNSVSGPNAAGEYTVNVTAELLGEFDNTLPGNDDFVDLDISIAVTDVNGLTANGTASARVFDDEAIANPDVDTTASGFADGNVLTGVGTVAGNANADIDGADGFAATAAVGLSLTDTEVTGGTNIAGAGLSSGVGTLTLAADGSYTYQITDPEATGTDTFYYTIEDGDGDYSTTSIIINLDGEPMISGLEGEGGDALVDEDDLDQTGTLKDGSDLAGPDNPFDSGTFNVTASDGIGNITIGLVDVVVNGAFGGVPIDIVTSLGTLTITGYTPNVDDTAGEIAYTYTLSENTETHAVAGDSEDLTSQDAVFDDFAVVLTDTDTGVSNAVLSVSVIDDVPDAQLRSGDVFGGEGGLVLPVLSVDETADQQPNPEDTVGDRQSMADFSVLFNNDVDHEGDSADDVVFGADGPAAAGSVVYGFSLTSSVGGGDPLPVTDLGVESGLYAVDATDVDAGDGDGLGQGEQIRLYSTGATIEGRIGGNAGELYFTVALNDVTGEITLTQAASPTSIWHPLGGAEHDDVVSLDGTGDLGAGEVLYEINLSQTVTDADGDVDTTTVNLADVLPSNAQGEVYAFNFRDDGPSVTADETIPALSVDETDLSTNASASFAGVFTSTFGADGMGATATSYALSLGAGATGLTDTATGEAVVLVMNGLVVEGRSDTT
ncbi:MAG: retention module-containing protein, partial [Halioglobus sp.]